MAREDVGEQTNRQREQPHQVREHLEKEDRDGHPARDAARDQPFEIADRALGAHAFDGVGDEHHERQHERDREVGGGRVQREGRDVQRRTR